MTVFNSYVKLPEGSKKLPLRYLGLWRCSYLSLPSLGVHDINDVQLNKSRGGVINGLRFQCCWSRCRRSIQFLPVASHGQRHSIGGTSSSWWAMRSMVSFWLFPGSKFNNLATNKQVLAVSGRKPVYQVPIFLSHLFWFPSNSIMFLLRITYDSCRPRPGRDISNAYTKGWRCTFWL